jgi:TonB family protein
MLQRNPRTEMSRVEADVRSRQPRKLLIALVLLLVALAIVLVKDREFWFGSDEATESGPVESQSVAKTDSAAVPAKAGEAPRVATAKNHVTARTPARVTTQPVQNEASNPVAPAVVTKRVVLPPLDVEVVAGDTHRTVRPGVNVAKVEILNDSNRGSAAASVPTNAAERERLSGGVPELRQTVESYPLLGEHTRVQGSVVLQALVGTDGNIEDLRVLSGPAILATAAQQAVRQWRFKPYLQNGQPVETKARIIVNFSIGISDNPPKTAQSNELRITNVNPS